MFIDFNFLFYLLLFVFISLFILMKRYINKKKLITKDFIFLNIFIIYIIAVFSIVFFPISFFEGRDINIFDSINLIPFVDYLKSLSDPTIDFSFLFKIELFIRNFFGNILLFVPLGFMLPVMKPKLRSLHKMIKVSLICTLSIETIQLIFSLFGSIRIFDIDDIILNLTGGILGYLLFAFTFKFKFFRNIYIKEAIDE